MTNISPADSSNRTIYRIGGTVCIILIAYSLATILLLLIIGSPPASVEDCFKMLHDNRVTGLLRLDILTIFILPLYFPLFISLYIALKKTDNGLVTLGTIIVFSGLTLVLATPSVFSFLDISDKFAKATSDIQKNNLIAAGESILASDMWHGSGARIGGLLLQTGALIISIVMLRTNVFNKLTAITGIVTHGLDLMHIIAGFFLPSLAAIFMAIAGILYLIWFPQIGLRLFKLKSIK
jgi:hypothetical protein